MRETVAKILIFNEHGQILMLRTGVFRTHPEKSHKPDLPGGMVDPNESERHAVVREAFEEAGIALDPNNVTLGYAETKYYIDGNVSVTKLLYVTQLNHTPEVAVSWEHEGFEWRDATSFLDTYAMRPFYKKAIEYILVNKLNAFS